MLFKTELPLIAIYTKKEWNDLLDEVDGYDFYHTFDYHNISKNTNDVPVLLKYEENNIIIAIPLLIRKIENTPYFDATSVYGYVGPLQKNTNNNFNNSLFIEALQKYFKDNKIISVFSRLHPYTNYQQTILKDFGTIASLSNVVNIDLTKSTEEQRIIFSKTTKRYINKCRKLFDVVRSDEEKDMLTFIDLYYENMDRVKADKKYYFSKQYFLDFVVANDYKTEVLFAVDKESKAIVSAAMMVKTNNIVQYHISGTRNDFLNVSPIRLLIDEMRIKSTEEGYEFFNLGGGLGNQEDELFRFKASFSKDYKPFKVWKYINDRDVYDTLVQQNNVEYAKTNFFPLYRYNADTVNVN